MSFGQQLAIGQVGESDIARWLLSRGHSVVPVYEKEIETGKGPRFFTPGRQYVAPDLLLLPKDNAQPYWIEAKHKSVFTWHRKEARWCTGIDLNHYSEYIAVQEQSKRPVWLLFLHRCDKPDARDVPYCPAICPVGLFGNSLAYLMKRESHKHMNWGRHGMVYWAHEDLRQLATLAEISAPQ
jgi:hypothetical protein